jgi:hypothetical protein
MPPEEQKERVPIKSLRTYQGDVEEAIGRNKESSTTIFVAEQKRKVENPEKVIEVKYNPTKNKVFVYLGAIFFILGILTIGGVYYFRYTEKTVVEQQTKTLLTFSKEKTLSPYGINKDIFAKKLLDENDGFKLPINSVLYINTTVEGQDSLGEVLALVGPNMPGSLVRSFDQNYMIGVYSYDTNEIFFILKVKDFASSYSGMLKWEKDMAKDMEKIYSIDPFLVSTSTPFIDEAIKNKDLRIIKDQNGKTQLLYSFIDKETLLITKNESIFGAILGRYTVSKQAK